MHDGGKDCGSSSVALLERYYSGDKAALGEVVSRHRDWLWGYVRRHMHDGHRVLDASEDIVQDVFERVVAHGPLLLPGTEAELRKLLATIVLNRLHDRLDWMHAQKRDRGVVSIDELDASRIGVAAPSRDRPSRVLSTQEEAQFLNLAMQLIDAEDARVIRLRNWGGLPFERIGKELNVPSDTARMRFHRAVRRLGTMVGKLGRGDLDDLAPDVC